MDIWALDKLVIILASGDIGNKAAAEDCTLVEALNWLHLKHEVSENG